MKLLNLNQYTPNSQRRRGDHQQFIRILLDPGYKFWIIYDFGKSKSRVGWITVCDCANRSLSLGIVWRKWFSIRNAAIVYCATSERREINDSWSCVPDGSSRIVQPIDRSRGNETLTWPTNLLIWRLPNREIWSRGLDTSSNPIDPEIDSELVYGFYKRLASKERGLGDPSRPRWLPYI